MEVAEAVPALRHLLDLLLLQLGPLRCPHNNPHEVPALQLTLRPIPRNLVLQLNRERAQGSLDRWPRQLRKIEQFLSSSLLPFSIVKLIMALLINFTPDNKTDISAEVWHWAQVSVTPLEECLGGLAPQPNNKQRTMLWLARPTRAALRALPGVLEAARRMRRPLPNVWTKIRAICKSVAGIWINW